MNFPVLHVVSGNGRSSTFTTTVNTGIAYLLNLLESMHMEKSHTFLRHLSQL